MMRKNLAALAVASFVLAACQTAPPTTGTATSTDPLAALAKFTLTDLQHASAEAKAGNDKLAALCYDYLAVKLQAQTPSDPNATVAGVVSAFEVARLGLRNGASGPSDDFQINCAPFLSDVRLNIAKLAAIAGGTAAISTVAPVLAPLILPAP